MRISIISVWLAFFLAACNTGESGETGEDLATGGDLYTTGGSATGGYFDTDGTTPEGGTISPDGSVIGPMGGTGGETDGWGSGGTGGTGGMNGSGMAVDSGGIPPIGGTGGITDSGVEGGGTGGTGGIADSGVEGGAGGTGGIGGSAPSEPQLITSAQSAYWQTGTLSEVGSGTANVTVNDSSTAQTWEGFGGSFNELGWSYLTTKEMQDQAMQLLFGQDGCRLAWGRIPMGASDYAMNRYTDDEVASGSSDYSMTNFSITRDKEKLIPYIKAAQAVKSDIRFWASPWTPPTWMKTGPYDPMDGPSNSNFDGGVMKSDEATLNAHAQYFVKFIQAYAEQGINIEIVAPQNEPNYQQNYPTCHWEPSTFTTFIGQHLGPALSAASLNVAVMLGTLSNPVAGTDPAVAAAVLANPTAKSYCKVMGVQWGMSSASQINTLKSQGPGIPIWLSEHMCGNNPWEGGDRNRAPNDHAYGIESWGYIRDAIKNGLTAYNAWNMVLDWRGWGIDDTRVWSQNALLVADSGQIIQTPAYYVFRHFSQFVEVGATRVDATGGDAVAFKNPDGSLVAIMFNGGAPNNNYTVSIGGKQLQFAMPGSGWATVKYKP